MSSSQCERTFPVIIASIVAVLLLIYLVYTLIMPEKF
ncbi:MAG: K(+)-transporting ATPase subunit F [Bacteroidetes bacterium]|nr:K(+)-transporting ATPase subunit F [Bacteroidota bacterium]